MMSKLGMHDAAPSAPDTFGLPEFFVSEVFTEIDGPNIRVICGVRRAGKVHWLYSAVMRADLLMSASRQCDAAAREAFSLQEIMDCRRGH